MPGKKKYKGLICTDEESKHFIKRGERTRYCMKCRQPFLSMGLRICSQCTIENAHVGKIEGKAGIRTRSSQKGKQTGVR